MNSIAAAIVTSFILGVLGYGFWAAFLLGVMLGALVGVFQLVFSD